MARPVRVLAVDYGDRRVGLAVSDQLGIAAHGLPTLQVKSRKEAARAVVHAANQHGVSRIVIGLPLNMDGTEGPRALVTREFGRECEEVLAAERSEVRIVMLDERLTTMRARAALREQGLRERSQRAKVDRVSATVLLQDYLSAQSATEGSHDG